MDLSGSELFLEILIAGVLFAVGLSPIFALLTESDAGTGQDASACAARNPAAHAAPAQVEGAGQVADPKEGSKKSTDSEVELFPGIKDWKDLKPWMIVAVAIVYAVGVGGNRLAEEVYKELPWVSFHGTASDATQKVMPDGKNGDATQKVVTDYDYFSAERALLRNPHAEIFRDWVERHKSYRKILRAGSASSLLFMISVLLYQLVGKGTQRLYRNPGRLCAVAGLLFVFFTYAFREEDKHFKKDLWQDYQDHKAQGISEKSGS